MAEFVDYKEVPIGDKNYWEVDRDLVQGSVGNEIGWYIEYKPVWNVEGGIAGVNANYEIKVNKEGAEPAEKRGLYDLCIENHMDIPDSISKESPCYKQFMKESEGM